MDFEKWIAEQSEDVQKAFGEHVAGLKTALKTERDASMTLQKQVKEITEKAATAEAAQKQFAELQAKYADLESGAAANAQALTEAQAKLGETSKQFGFFKAAAAQGISNPDNAFLIAQGKGLLGDDGALDWKEFQKMAPEQFVSTTASASNPARGRVVESDPFTEALMRGAGLSSSGG